MLNCLMYKLCYYRYDQILTEAGEGTHSCHTLTLTGKPTGYDRVRGVEIGNKGFTLEHLEEAYTSEHWLVRIYRVLPPSNRM